MTLLASLSPRRALAPAALLCSLALAACGPAEDLDAADLDAASQAVTTCRGAPYPIILAHGMAGFDRIGPLNYFFQVAADLRARGETVVESQVPAYESSAVRAPYLRTYVDDTLRATGACKVNIVAHSQGGLDARYLISSLGYGGKVASLTTVSTPHRGTPVADVALGLVPGFSYTVINAILDVVYGIGRAPGDAHIQASLRQFVRSGMTAWNTKNRDDSRVKYFSVAGRSALALASGECTGGVWSNGLRVDVLNPLIAVTGAVFNATSPNPLDPDANDGLVSVASARWGTFLGCVPADHLDEVGQIALFLPDPLSGFNHKDLYRRIVSHLRGQGL